MRFLSLSLCALGLAAPLSIYLGCSPTPAHVFTTSSGAGAGGQGGGTGGATTTKSSTATMGQGGDLGIDAGHHDGGVGGGPINCTPGGPNDDVDMDGWTPAQGDCDDCDPNVNPNAVEVPTPQGGVAKD